MAGETTLTIVGNLTADPELRYTQNGLAVVNFTIASTHRIFDRNTNEWRDGDAIFLRANAWKDFAENIASAYSKGSHVIAQGTLKQRSWETKEGEKRSAFELEVSEIGLATKKTAAPTNWTESPATPEQSVATRSSDDFAGYNDETPF